MELTNREAPSDLRQRTLLAALFVALVFALLGWRLHVLQVGEGDSWRSLSENNRIRIRRVPATRGVIADRNGEPLVDNRPSFDVVLVPEDTRDLTDTIRRITDVLGEDVVPPAATIRAQSRNRPPYEGLIVARDVSWDAVVALETRQLDLPGVSLQIGPRRTYPWGESAGHLLGYVGEVSERDLGTWPGYRLGDLAGKYGTEGAFETFLHGTAGGQQIEVDSLGRRLRVLSEVPETQGNGLILTLDRRLQQFSEQRLEDHEGSIVVLRPKTGEVLAMVSRPAFDPNVFAHGVRAKDWRALISDKKKPLNNRAIQGVYPPGSTFKIVTAAAALEEGAINPFTRIYCGGSYAFAGRNFRCWKKGGHGAVNLHEALVHSCDVYFYQVGQKLGVDAIAEYAHRFGLGDVSGISLAHEKGGLIPTSEWKRKRFGEPWFAGETLSVAIGQGYVLATPLQMANVVATVANGGTLYRPHIVKRIESAGGDVVKEIQPEVIANAGLRKSTLAQLREALRGVVNDPGGTGKKAKLPTIDVGGKTGTSQVFQMARQMKTSHLKRELRDHAWFVAFAPVDDPEIAIAVLVEHAGGGGGQFAAPIARDIADFYFGLTRGRTYQLAGPGSSPTRGSVAVSPEAREQLAGGG